MPVMSKQKKKDIYMCKKENLIEKYKEKHEELLKEIQTNTSLFSENKIFKDGTIVEIIKYGCKLEYDMLNTIDMKIGNYSYEKKAFIILKKTTQEINSFFIAYVSFILAFYNDGLTYSELMNDKNLYKKSLKDMEKHKFGNMQLMLKQLKKQGSYNEDNQFFKKYEFVEEYLMSDSAFETNELIGIQMESIDAEKIKEKIEQCKNNGNEVEKEKINRELFVYLASNENIIEVIKKIKEIPCYRIKSYILKAIIQEVISKIWKNKKELDGINYDLMEKKIKGIVEFINYSYLPGIYKTIVGLMRSYVRFNETIPHKISLNESILNLILQNEGFCILTEYESITWNECKNTIDIDEAGQIDEVDDIGNAMYNNVKKENNAILSHIYSRLNKNSDIYTFDRIIGECVTKKVSQYTGYIQQEEKFIKELKELIFLKSLKVFLYKQKNAQSIKSFISNVNERISRQEDYKGYKIQNSSSFELEPDIRYLMMQNSWLFEPDSAYVNAFNVSDKEKYNPYSVYEIKKFDLIYSIDYGITSNTNKIRESSKKNDVFQVYNQFNEYFEMLSNYRGVPAILKEIIIREYENKMRYITNMEIAKIFSKKTKIISKDQKEDFFNEYKGIYEIPLINYGIEVFSNNYSRMLDGRGKIKFEVESIKNLLNDIEMLILKAFSELDPNDLELVKARVDEIIEFQKLDYTCLSYNLGVNKSYEYSYWLKKINVEHENLREV